MSRALTNTAKKTCHIPRQASFTEFETGEEVQDDTPEKFRTVLQALMHAAERGTLTTNKIYVGKYTHIRYINDESEGYWDPVGEIDPQRTTVDVEVLKTWLASRGVTTGFFFPEASDTPDYLNAEHPRYARRLAAAVNAWLAVTQASGKSVKDAIKKWLREHAAEYGLTNDDGNPNETGIEEVAKVANWQPTGGAPKTPGQ